jgi:hypothetical protein
MTDTIAWAIVAFSGIVSITLLLLKGVIKSGIIDYKGSRLEIGATPDGKQVKLSPSDQALLAMASLTDRKYQTASEVRAAQKRAIEDYYDRFMDILSKANYLPAELLWRHFTDPLVNAAEENHILGKVQPNGQLDPYYVQEKLILVQSRHSRMLSKHRGCLPEWLEIETDLQMLMVAALNDFVCIAQKKWGSFRQSVDDSRGYFPRTGFLLDRLIEGL